MGRAVRLVLCLILYPILTACVNSDSTATDDSSTLTGCALNVALTSSCSVSTSGAYVTTSIGSNITSYTNSGATTSITATIPSGFYSNKSVTFTDSNLVSANIKSGITIFGVTGSAPSFASNAYRTLGSTQLSSASEATNYAGIALPASGGYLYREVPSITKDDDGTSGGSVTYVNRATWTVGGLTCGLSGSIDQRIADCASQLGSAATWSGATYGNAGQSTWKIVTRTGNCTVGAVPYSGCKEIWRDESTRLLWSSRVSEGLNWCKATGNNNIGGNPSAEDDPSDYCDNATYQNTSGTAVSACFDDQTNFTLIDGGITNGSGRGGLGKGSSPAVAWRLPTKADYEQANLNGLRYVMPDAGANIAGAGTTYEWTASVLSITRSSAWRFDAYLGFYSTTTRDTSVGVRCVGR